MSWLSKAIGWDAQKKTAQGQVDTDKLGGMLEYDVAESSNIFGGQDIGDLGMRMLTDPGRTPQGERAWADAQKGAYDQAGYAGQMMQQAGARAGSPGAAATQQAMGMMSQAGESALLSYNQSLDRISGQGTGLMGMAQTSNLANMQAQNQMRSGVATGTASQYSQNVANKAGVASQNMAFTQGLIGQAAGAWMAASDERLKDGIQFLEERNGHNWYTFGFKEHPMIYQGVMAQEVQEYLPEAVIERDGILMVYYGRL